jgi:long-chain fatty acid transport protein
MTRVKGKTELSDLSDAAAGVFGGSKYSADTETDLNLPQSLILGYAFRPGPWSFEADAEWVDYSSIGETFLDFKGESDATRLGILNTGNPIKRDWHSTWNFGFGTNYKFNDIWQARGGYYFYPEAVPEHTWDPSVPDSATNGFTFGGSFSVASLTIDLAYNFIYFQKRTIHNNVGADSASTVNGEYKTKVHVVSMNLTYRFGGD